MSEQGPSEPHAPTMRRSQVVFATSLSEVAWPEHAVLIADAALPQSLLDQLPQPLLLVDAGEPLKRLASIEALAERVLARRATRPLTLVAVVGGSLGDAVGFLASILWRGVTLWHLPTTLLAMVDSAHGGKTAVNLGVAKNQLGTFYPAHQVLILEEILATLPLAQRRHGLTELVKGLWLGDAEALSLLDQHAEALTSAPYDEISSILKELLRRAIDVKLEVVARDPFETLGLRTTLNLGHTAAHALELEYGAPHGLAVAWGMAACALLSESRGPLPHLQVKRLLHHLDPLLSPLSPPAAHLSPARFAALVARDKKRVASTLRSVLLDAPGQARVTTEVSGEDWYQALVEVERRHRTGRYLCDWRTPRHTAPRLEASKSELNRALLLAHLRPGPTEVLGESEADDVRHMRRALDKLARTPHNQPVELYVGQGGTTLRFVMVAALLHEAPVVIRADEALLRRPHTPLFDALATLGAQITPHEDYIELRREMPLKEVLAMEVRIDTSSQYASALAMLAASGRAVRLQLRTSLDVAQPAFERERAASFSYFQMTLELLRHVGVVVSCDERSGVVTLDGRGAATQSAVVRAEADASSAAFWHVARFLGAPVTLEELPQSARQADDVLPHILARLDAARDQDEVIEVDLHDAPDLAPVLSAAAVHVRAGLRIVNAAHLRAKESNRIEDLVEAYRRVGITVLAREDGLEVPVGVQRASRDEGAWPTFEDHRVAMAGLLCALRAPLEIVHPWVVTKSYPALIEAVREAGARVRWLPQ